MEELGRADLLDHVSLGGGDVSRLRKLSSITFPFQLPENNALTGLCEGLIEAWKIYNNPKAAILFIVEDITYNICDQRFHEFEIRRLNPQVRVLRRTLTEVFERGHMTDKRQLIVYVYFLDLYIISTRLTVVGKRA